ncbi:cyclic pyranopterin monophosphate synthase MoaC [Alicyclobacillus vulcanalis]|uniref:Cyclic pyranopterin monophosphate synthase n=1 Tax=Alicyclobacillus vulcanalis TaxID=252246 RepID=A0A1N7KMF0_9BACL|nr:cyclic pyranopterin monophosphate synthase MoaC [Alicyclobacillus vulcanalis]SIS62666.1 cyclic pyranopterin monophosphate synthase subunit MoaC [Alicyclobacillus vulcanalis]
MESQDVFHHFSSDGRPHMVDVSAKPVTSRTAIAEAYIHMARATRDAIVHQAIAKGDVMKVAEIAGIMAAKRTSDLVPLCHPVPLHHVAVRIEEHAVEAEEAVFRVTAEVRTAHQTGVEMEALTAASVAALTVYDMCKKADRGMTISQVRLVFKDGGASGRYERVDAGGPADA